jgi:hypothetical protein
VLFNGKITKVILTAKAIRLFEVKIVFVQVKQALLFIA